MMIKLFIVCLSIIQPIYSQCDLSFKIGKTGTEYSSSNFSSFIEKEIRSRFSRIKKNFDVFLIKACSNQESQATKLKMNTHFLYITEINGIKVESDVSRYTDDNIEISSETIEKQIELAVKFSEISKKAQQDILKTFAFIVAEAARFSSVEDATNQILKKKCRIKWLDYEEMVRRWKTISIFVNSVGDIPNNPIIGGTRAMLIVPITNYMIEKYNDFTKNKNWKVVRGRKYGAPRVIDKESPISQGSISCAN